MLKKLSKLALLFVFIVSLFYPLLVKAQGFDFAVVPAKLDFELYCGEKETRTFKLYNKGVDPVKLYGYIEDYWITPDNNFEFYPVGTKEYSSGKWITLSREEVIVQPGDYEEVSVTVDVPKNIEAGGYYSVVFFEARGKPAEEAAAQLIIHGRIGVIVLTTVHRTGEEGEIRREGAITDLKVQVNWRPFIKNFSFDIRHPIESLKNLKNVRFDFAALIEPEVKATTIFKNLGNTYLHCAGFDLFRNSFTGRENRVDLPEMTVLDQSERNFEAKWEKAPFFSRASVNSLIAYRLSGNQQKELEKSASFWIIPWTLIILLAILAFVIFNIWRFIRKKRKGKGGGACPHCGHKLKEKAKFCSHCGKVAVSNLCPKCGAKIKEETKFCPECGSKLKQKN